MNYCVVFRMKTINRFVFSVLTFFSVSVESQLCNGMKELCSLQINQVTLAGSHNAGAGFDGLLYYHKIAKLPAVSCLYRNQRLSITAQLDLGIRYFDVDACWDKFYKPESPWTCHQRAFGGSIKAILEQVDAWMKINKNDVVVLHFNRDSTDPDKTGEELKKKKYFSLSFLTLNDKLKNPTKKNNAMSCRILRH